ncbi:paeninodin family lasso peptide [Cohnella sp. GCM10012308]
MKKDWASPVLEVLEVRMTMKFFPPVHPPGGGGPGGGGGEDCPPDLDS